MQQNQLLLGTFLNFLMLLNKRKNANIKNIAVFIFLHDAMIWSFLVHFFYKPTIFFVHQRPKSTQHAKKIARFSFVDEYKGVVDEYKGVVTPLKSPILIFFHTLYPITLFE